MYISNCAKIFNVCINLSVWQKLVTIEETTDSH